MAILGIESEFDDEKVKNICKHNISRGLQINLMVCFEISTMFRLFFLSKYLFLTAFVVGIIY